MKTIPVLALTVFLSACASFNPQPGMSFRAFEQSAGLSGKGSPEIVGMNKNITVYRLTGFADKNIFYWFENGRLVRVSQGELPVIRKQIEIINR